MLGLSLFERNKSFCDQFGISYDFQENDAYIQRCKEKNLKPVSLNKMIGKTRQEIIPGEAKLYAASLERLHEYLEVMTSTTGTKFDIRIFNNDVRDFLVVKHVAT